MPLMLKPHLVQICPDREETDPLTNEVLTESFSSGRQVRCRVAPVSAEAAFTQFGVMLSAPAKLLCELSDAPTDEETNARVRFNGTWYRVKGVVRHTSTPECGYASVLLQRED